MPIFEYKGLTRDGKNVKGTLDSENLRAARLKLKKDGIFVSEISDKKKGSVKKIAAGRRTGKVPVKDISLMTFATDSERKFCVMALGGSAKEGPFIRATNVRQNTRPVRKAHMRILF